MWTSTRWLQRSSALIVILWICGLLGSASTASLAVPQEPRPNPENANAQTKDQVTQWIPKSVFSEQEQPTPAHQAESPQPKQQDNKEVAPPLPPGQPAVIEIKQTTKWNEPIVLATLIVGAIYAIILIVYYFQLVEMRKAASAATDASKIARETLIATNRAWLTVDISIGEPLVFVENGGARTTVTFRMRNLGDAPAIHITPHAWLVRSEGLWDPHMRLPREEQIRKCEELKKQPLSEGFTLFPGDSFPESEKYGAWGVGVSISREEIEKGLTPYAPFKTDAAGQKTPVEGFDPNRKYLSLVIVGCIDYGFVSDPGRHHQTGFAYELRKTKGGVAPAPLISPDDKLIPIENLRIDGSPYGVGRYAD